MKLEKAYREFWDEWFRAMSEIRKEGEPEQYLQFVNVIWLSRDITVFVCRDGLMFQCKTPEPSEWDKGGALQFAEIECDQSMKEVLDSLTAPVKFNVSDAGMEWGSNGPLIAVKRPEVIPEGVDISKFPVTPLVNLVLWQRMARPKHFSREQARKRLALHLTVLRNAQSWTVPARKTPPLRH